MRDIVCTNLFKHDIFEILHSAPSQRQFSSSVLSFLILSAVSALSKRMLIGMTKIIKAKYAMRYPKKPVLSPCWQKSFKIRKMQTRNQLGSFFPPGEPSALFHIPLEVRYNFTRRRKTEIPSFSGKGKTTIWIFTTLFF